LKKKKVATAAKASSATSIVFVPAPFIESVQATLKNTQVNIGAQDCHYEAKGAFTGSMSISMIKDMKCNYVLAGHSERRSIFGDNDAIVNKKVRTILDAGLNCVLCIGEQKEEFDLALTKSICAIQLGKGLAGVSEAELSRVIIAYEPGFMLLF
jgi:triosephosphate isomerase (TIM)